MPIEAMTKREPTIKEIMKLMDAALREFSQEDAEHREIESVYHKEAETLEVRVMYPHHVNIYSVEVKYRDTFSG